MVKIELKNVSRLGFGYCVSLFFLMLLFLDQSNETIRKKVKSYVHTRLDSSPDGGLPSIIALFCRVSLFSVVFFANLLQLGLVVDLHGKSNVAFCVRIMDVLYGKIINTSIDNNKSAPRQ